MDSIKNKIHDLQKQIDESARKIKFGETVSELEDLRHKLNDPDLWRDQKKALEISKQQAKLAAKARPWQKIKADIIELSELAAIADVSMQKEIAEQLSGINKRLVDLKKDLRYQGEYDDRDVILSLYAGAGGTDAQDWTQMLHRMYIRWADSHKLAVVTLDQSSGEEAGIKSLTMKISGGSNLYGKLAGENGVHRLVRLSPFNADHLRQTSFAKVEILPLLEKPEELELDDKDLNVDVFRASGHGGQSVNTTDSAVRVTHIPTGLSAAIQNERSQLQNKETALNILRSKLMKLKMEQHAAAIKDLKGPNQSVEWGNQIRNYVLHPYKQVKDLRSGYETSDPQKVLDGGLDPVINSWLEHKVGK